MTQQRTPAIVQHNLEEKWDALKEAIAEFNSGATHEKGQRAIDAHETFMPLYLKGRPQSDIDAVNRKFKNKIKAALMDALDPAHLIKTA